jgi:hypothetical protein
MGHGGGPVGSAVSPPGVSEAILTVTPERAFAYEDAQVPLSSARNKAL